MSEVSGPDGLEASGERLKAILEELHSESRDVQASMIVTHDGLTMLVLGSVIDPDRFGAMCADLLSLCRSAAAELVRGQIEQVLMKATSGYMLLTPAGQQAVLAIMARPDTNLGMLLIDAARAAAAIPGSL